MKKGQAALEFITNYGWSLLIILVVVGALLYFGFFTPTTFVKESCSLDMPLSCPVFSLVETSEGLYLDVLLENTQGKTLYIHDLSLQEKGSMGDSCNASSITDNNNDELSSEALASYGSKSSRLFRFHVNASTCNFSESGLTDLTEKKGNYKFSIYYSQEEPDAYWSVSSGSLVAQATNTTQ